jgi:hypothetical protein
MGGRGETVVDTGVVGEGVGVACGWVVQPAKSTAMITPQMRIIEAWVFI